MKNKSFNKRQSVFYAEFREDLSYWIKSDRKVVSRIMDIIEAIMRNPFEGIGKPEPLKYLGSNVWSRRITQEHRIVYVINNDRIEFIQCRYHY